MGSNPTFAFRCSSSLVSLNIFYLYFASSFLAYFLSRPHKILQGLVSKGLQADQWVQKVIEVVGGKGGGTATTAQASGPNLDQLPQALSVARTYANSKLQ